MHLVGELDTWLFMTQEKDANVRDGIERIFVLDCVLPHQPKLDIWLV